MNRNIFRNYCPWLVVLSFIILEYVLFRSYVLREITGYYPANFDQANYLFHSYSVFENIQQHGLIDTLQRGYGRLATSTLFNFQTACFFLISGASRLSALSINFLFFALLQLITFKTAKDLTGKYIFAFLFWGLLLLTETAYFWAGGIFDFRIDYAAYCLFGILVTSILQSNIFLKRQWTWISALIAIYLILIRHLTAAYVLSITLTLLIYLFLFDKENRNSRIKNIMLFCAIIAIGTLPFLWLAKDDIYNYYIVGHTLNNEKFVRALQVGVSNFTSNLLFYPRTLIKSHLGSQTANILLVLIISAFFLRKHSFKFTNPIVVFLILSIMLPLIILTSDLAKSVVVVNIVVVPILWLVWWIFYSSSAQYMHNKYFKAIILFTTIIILTLGIKNTVSEMRHHNKEPYRIEQTQISKMYDDIGNYMLSKKQSRIHFSADHIADYLIHDDLRVLYYENHRIMLNVGGTLIGGGILYKITYEAALSELKKPQVLIIGTDPYHISPDDYPFNIAIEPIRPKLLNYVEKHYQQIGSYTFKNNHYKVFVRL